jgi:hypothetical protein
VLQVVRLFQRQDGVAQGGEGSDTVMFWVGIILGIIVGAAIGIVYSQFKSKV